MKRGDRVEIRRGIWRGCTGRITEIIAGGERYGVLPDVFTAGQPLSLAASSVRPVAKQ